MATPPRASSGPERQVPRSPVEFRTLPNPLTGLFGNGEGSDDDEEGGVEIGGALGGSAAAGSAEAAGSAAAGSAMGSAVAALIGVVRTARTAWWNTSNAGTTALSPASNVMSRTCRLAPSTENKMESDTPTF